MSSETSKPTKMFCAMHGRAFTHGCPGCDEAEYWDIAKIVSERMRNDTGERITLEELANELGFDLAEIRAELDAEDERGL